jgi:nicotinamide mononucleotide transporter
MAWSQLFTSPLELFAVVTGIACVFLITVSVRIPVRVGGRHLVTIDHVANWPVGILTSAAYVYIFWHSRLYLNSVLQVFYVGSGFLGWYWWLRGGAHAERLPIRRISSALLAGTLAAIVVATVVMTAVMRDHTDSAAPLWDALVVCLSLAAQLVMTRKYFEHWWLWLSVDAVGIVLFASQDLLLTSVLYVVYAGLCVRGLVTWRRMQLAVVPVPLDGPWSDWDSAGARA